MDAAALGREIRAFDSSIPIERASTPPSSWYVAPEIAALERRAVWAKTWQLAARADEVAEPGDFVAITVAEEPLLVLRDESGKLRAFHNVCRHKASTLCEGRGRADELHCPYHGWRYRLDGSLKSAPQLGAIERFERDEMGLFALSVEAWGPWIFVHLDAAPAPLGAQAPELAAALDARGLQGLEHRGRARWDIECNWKAFCDNYLDGGYHIPNMHPTLDSQLAMEGYRTETFERSSIQSAPPGAGGHAELRVDPGERIAGGAIYGWLYPNFMVNRYGPVLDINVVRPTGPQTCEVTFDWWFDTACDDAFVAASIAQTRVTQEEDVLISKRVQAGLRSAAYSTGRYAPQKETGIHHFHRILAAALRAELDGEAGCA